jgi:16S rRNA (guanine527-N7)-methyltransferase
VTAADIAQAVASAGLSEIDLEAAEKFSSYLDLLLRWNSKLNLTAIREPEQILRRHFLECIFCAQQLPDAIQTLLDFGSGAGLPGIPIAICRPAIAVTLGESQAKKASFLREVVRTLDLNAEIFDGRIETMAPNRTFDAVTLRAVDKMQDACRTALPRVKAGGYMTLFATEANLAELTSFSSEVSWGKPIALPGSKQAILLIGRR